MATSVVYEPVRVLFHLDTVTKLVYERYEAHPGMLEDPTFDLPTAQIPRRLRRIGSRFVVEVVFGPGLHTLDLDEAELRRRARTPRRIFEHSPTGTEAARPRN